VVTGATVFGGRKRGDERRKVKIGGGSTRNQASMRRNVPV